MARDHLKSAKNAGHGNRGAAALCHRNRHSDCATKRHGDNKDDFRPAFPVPWMWPDGHIHVVPVSGHFNFSPVQVTIFVDFKILVWEKSSALFPGRNRSLNILLLKKVLRTVILTHTETNLFEKQA